MSKTRGGDGGVGELRPEVGGACQTGVNQVTRKPKQLITRKPENKKLHIIKTKEIININVIVKRKSKKCVLLGYPTPLKQCIKNNSIIYLPTYIPTYLIYL